MSGGEYYIFGYECSSADGGVDNLFIAFVYCFGSVEDTFGLEGDDVGESTGGCGFSAYDERTFLFVFPFVVLGEVGCEYGGGYGGEIPLGGGCCC